MNEQMKTTLREKILVEQIICRPLTFVEFRDQVHNYTTVLSTTLEELRGINTILGSVANGNCSNINSFTKPIMALSTQVNAFYNFIEQSTYLPLSVIPHRLPVIIALKEGDTDVKQINKMYAEFPKISGSVAAQAGERLQTLQDKLAELFVDIEEILHQTCLLLDRARFPAPSNLR